MKVPKQEQRSGRSVMTEFTNQSITFMSNHYGGGLISMISIDLNIPKQYCLVDISLCNFHLEDASLLFCFPLTRHSIIPCLTITAASPHILEPKKVSQSVGRISVAPDQEGIE